MSAAKKHTPKLGKQLTGEQHVLLRPNMYIGSTSKEKFTQYVLNEYKDIEYVPGLLKLVNEILDNCIDVAISTNFQYANKIDVELTNDYVKIKDNGTGLAVEKVKDMHGNDVWNPVLCWSYINAGTNFGTEDEPEERMTIGMNGVGSTAVSIFSKSFIGETADGKKKLRLQTENNNHIKDVSVGRSKQKYTKVYFEPEFSRFESVGFDENHIQIIEDRIHKLAALYPQITFTFNTEKIKYKSTKDYLKTFGLDYVYEETDDILISFMENNNEEFRFVSVVNGLNIPNGGTHIDFICEKLAEHLRPLIKKKHKIDVVPSQIKQHLFLVNFCKNFTNLKFDSQTKESIKNTKTEIQDAFDDFDFERLANKMIKKDSIITPIIEYQLMKAEQAKKRKLASEQRKALKEKVAKHIAPNKRNTGKNILYIVEGDSAKGNFMGVRNRDHHGIYPLKGKFMNVSRKSEIDILKNNECKDLMSILGLKLGEKAPNKMPYSKIYITADADMDGYCITAQVLNFFSLWPELFERNMIHIVYTPIMEIRKNNKITNVFYTLGDYQKYKLKSGEKIKYLKGLGSMNPSDYERYLIKSPRVERVENDNEAEHFLQVAFGDDIQSRKEWLSQ